MLKLAMDDMKLRTLHDCPVDQQPVTADQLYPAVVSLAESTIITWEDRRPGLGVPGLAIFVPTEGAVGAAGRASMARTRSVLPSAPRLCILPSA